MLSFISMVFSNERERMEVNPDGIENGEKLDRVDGGKTAHVQ